jgi:hypothetical protein
MGVGVKVLDGAGRRVHARAVVGPVVGQEHGTRLDVRGGIHGGALRTNAATAGCERCWW